MKRLGSLFGLVLLSLGLLGVSSAANAQLAGNLDPSFGSGEIVAHGLGSGEYPSIGGIAVQPDGKIVVAGGSTPGDHGLLLARYLPDGSPDPSFGDRGYVETHFTYWAFAHAVALQPDGKIIVAGGSYPGDDTVLSEFTLARYNPDGSLDTSFGVGGITNTVIPKSPSASESDAGASALAVLPNGEILVGGSSEWGGPTDPSGSFALAEYRASGSLDPTFGDGGIVQTQFYGDDYLGGIAVQPDGKIVATGIGGRGGHGQDIETMALARYQPDGLLDPTFGTAGKVTTAQKLGYDGGPPALQHGKVVVAGFTRANSASNFFPVIARYQGRGRLDSTFGKHGFVEIRRVTGTPSAILAQNDGKILIATYPPADETQAGDGVVVRLRPNGRLDTSFGRRGIVSLHDDQLFSLALQTDQKILVGGNGNATDPILHQQVEFWTLARLIGGNNCVVPGLRGETVSRATTTLKRSYCRRSRISKRFSNKVPRGRVISTTPSRGARLLHGAKIHLVVSKGKPAHTTS